MIGNLRLPRRPSSLMGFGKALGLLSLAAIPALRAQSPEISRISPMAARPGETVEVTLQGKNLLEPQQLWTSFGSKVEWEAQAPGKNGKTPKPDGKSLIGKLTLAAEAPLGLGFLRLPTATGLSGPLFFLVDELPVVAKNPQNASAEKAQAITAPAAIEGMTETGRSDFYRLEMKAGESISVEAFAARIGSKMDPVLRLLDEKGQELASVDDTLGLAGDCRLRHRAVADGPLIVEIRDAAFTGGGEYFYHLRVGDFPLVSAVFPPVAAPGETVEVLAQGEAVEGVAPLRVTAQKSATGIEAAPVRFGPGKPAAFAYVRTDDSPLYIEKTPNDATGTAMTVTAPCTVLGRIREAGDRNIFLIATKKGERITLTPLTRNIGSPAVLYLGVDDEKGNLVASNDNPGNTAVNDTALTFLAPADGVCRVSVEDIAHRGGNTFVYGVHIETSTQGFDLTASADRFVAPRGGSFSTKITAQRRGVNGPIALELVSADALPLPPGFHREQNIIEKGKNETVLKVAAPADVPSGSLYHVRIVGRALENGAQFDAVATQPKGDPKKASKDPTMIDLGSMPQPPRLLCETFPICVGPDAPDFFAIELTAGGVDLPSIVCKNSFVLRQKAIDPGYAGEAQLRFEGLPPGVAITS